MEENKMELEKELTLNEVMVELRNITKLLAGEKKDDLIDIDIDRGSISKSTHLTRLYDQDVAIVEDICSTTKRSRAQVIRLLVHNALLNKLY